jgi:hypothetical protein
MRRRESGNCGIAGRVCSTDPACSNISQQFVKKTRENRGEARQNVLHIRFGGCCGQGFTISTASNGAPNANIDAGSSDPTAGDGAATSCCASCRTAQASHGVAAADF